MITSFGYKFQNALRQAIVFYIFPLVKNRSGDNEKAPDLHQRVPTEDSTPEVDGQSQQYRPVGKNRARSCGRLYPKKKMEMDWPHSPKAPLQHHQASPDLEPTREAEERTPTEHDLAAEPRGGRKNNGPDMKTRWRAVVDGLCSSWSEGLK